MAGQENIESSSFCDFTAGQKKIEIERRWLIQQAAAPESGSPYWKSRSIIEQGYLGAGIRVRIRERLDGDPSTSARRFRLESGPPPFECTLTQKTGKGLSRIEYELNIPLDVARLLMEAAKTKLEKVRYVSHDGWEYDTFRGPLEGFFLLERELSSVDEEVTLPSWVVKAVEVTESLTNDRLARAAHAFGSPDAAVSVDYVMGKRPLRVVLTGAPCAGKTTALRSLLKDEPNIKVIPEVATIVLGQAGITLASVGETILQATIRKAQLSFEEGGIEQAYVDGKDTVILDRGTLDSAAFMSGGLDAYCRIFQTSSAVEYSRYDAVILLRAPSREVFESNKTNNDVRTETYREALEVQNKLITVWSGHPRFYVVSDYDTWAAKYEAMRATINRLRGREEYASGEA